MTGDRERNSLESNTWAIGDSLLVKPGVTDPATGIALEDEGDRLSIQWDSLTLKSMPPAYLVACEEGGVPWSTMRLCAHDVLLTTARDREEDVTAALAALETQYRWLSLGEQGRRIRQIVNRAETHDLFAAFRSWHAYLQEHLVVPFVATVVADQRGPVQQGEQVTVTGIIFLDPGARSSGSDTHEASLTSRCVICGSRMEQPRSSNSSMIMRCGLPVAPLSLLDSPGSRHQSEAAVHVFLPNASSPPAARGSYSLRHSQTRGVAMTREAGSGS